MYFSERCKCVTRDSAISIKERHLRIPWCSVNGNIGSFWRPSRDGCRGLLTVFDGHRKLAASSTLHWQIKKPFGGQTSQMMPNDSHPTGSQIWLNFFRKRVDWILGIFLIAGTLAVYWPVSKFSFVNADDPVYVAENPDIQAGLTRASIKWAWSANVAGNWHPLTLLSYMLDCQLFHTTPGWPHVENVLLHTMDSLLLFVLLLKMTRQRWPAFLVAAFFAWHPMHVESVAWIAERKDVLSTCFWMLTMLAYVGYARESKVKSRKPVLFYVLSLLFFALGLMSKPMLVTLPFVLLLMDYWPLRRVENLATNDKSGFHRARWPWLALEKVPFLILTVISCVLTFRAQSTAGAVAKVPLDYRIANACLAYWRYVGKLFWPANLAVIYPYRQPETNLLFWLAGLLLIGLCVVALLIRKRPYVATGWFWYLGTLVPVIGLVQVGSQSMADRYSYVPSIGFFMVVVFGLSELAGQFQNARRGLIALASLSLVLCVVVTRHQVRYWSNSKTLFRHTVEVTHENSFAANNLGSAVAHAGRLNEAAEWYLKAVKWSPAYTDAHYNLGFAYDRLHEREKAREQYAICLRLNPKQALVHFCLGNESLTDGDLNNAIENYRAELLVNPTHPLAHYQLAALLTQQNQPEAAIEHYQDAIRLKPDWPATLNDFAWFLATQPDARFRNGKEAVQLATRASVLAGQKNPGALDTLAAAYAEAGQFNEALQTAKQASALARAASKDSLADEIDGHSKLYEQGKPYHQSAPPIETQTKPPTETDKKASK
jgi:tetratricopeptide (TPR) repeat protein